MSKRVIRRKSSPRRIPARPLSFWRFIKKHFLIVAGLLFLPVIVWAVMSSYGTFSVLTSAADKINAFLRIQTQKEKEYRRWEFKGTTEGWVGEGNTQLKPSSDALVVVFSGNSGGSLRQDRVATTLPYRNKYLKAVLALTSDVSIPGPVLYDKSLSNSTGSTVGASDEGSQAPGSVEGGAGSGIVSNEPGTGDVISPDEMNKAKPIEWPDPSDPTCTPRPPPCTSDPCPLYEPAPPRGGWCPTPKCTPCPVSLIDGGCPLLMDPGEGGWCPGKPTPVQGGTTFNLTILYQLKGKTTWEKPVVKQGLTSKGSYTEFAVLLPEINPMTIEKLRLQVSNIKPQGNVVTQDYTLLIDRIRLVGSVLNKPQLYQR